MNRNITLGNVDRNALTTDVVGAIDIDESLLTNIAGGCKPANPDCMTTFVTSCVPPGTACP